MFMIKKIISQCLSPVPLIIIFILAGLFYLWFTKKQVWGKLLVSFGFIVLLLASNRQVSDRIIGYLESSYMPRDIQLYDDSSDTGERMPVQFIVVLGGGHTPNPDFPVSSQLSDTSMVRLIEGIRMYRKYPGSKLILSGGSVFTPVPNAVIMAGVAQDLGVDEDDIILESESKDTLDEAILIKPLVRDEQFILVTSAAHMPRSMAMFKKQGMNPLPFPAGHMFLPVKNMIPLDVFPDSHHLKKSSRAVHEYLGIIWARLRGQI